MHKKIFFFCSEGLSHILWLLVLCLLVSIYSFQQPLVGIVAVLLWLLFFEFCYFFRDPERNIPSEPGAIVAPADGKIIGIQRSNEEVFMKQECIRISIFMNIFSVHVNRAPISGTIDYQHYHPGEFFSAFKEKASLDNEQVAIGIVSEGERKRKIFVKLIAGLIARRIVVWKHVGDRLSRGERMSIIKFGSRVDVYLPLEAQVTVNKGEWVKAGETRIGVIN